MREDMDNKVDKLFKDKLEGDSLQPSARAWEKVEAHLTKKNRMVLWLRVAAAIALLGLLTFAALKWTDDDSAKPKFANDRDQQKNNEQNPDSHRDAERQEPKKENVEGGQERVRQPVAEAPAKKKLQKKFDLKTAPAEEQKQEIIDVVPQQESIHEQEVAVVTPAVAGGSPDGVGRGITLTYSLPAVRKTEAPQVATVEPKKSGLERVLEIAKDVKNSDNPLGDLREAKDDIFAFEFKKDKSKKGL